MLKERLPGLAIWTMSFLSMATKVLLESESSSYAGYCGLLGTFGAIAVVIGTHWQNFHNFALPLSLPVAALLKMFVFANNVPLAQLVQWGPFTIALYLSFTLNFLPALLNVLLQGLGPHLRSENLPPAPEQGNVHTENDMTTGQRLEGSRKFGLIAPHAFKYMGPSSSIYSRQDSDISFEETAELAARKAGAKSISSILRLPKESSLLPDNTFNPKNGSGDYSYTRGLPDSVLSQDCSILASHLGDIHRFDEQSSVLGGGAD